jgi:hypothetical protein
MTRDQFVEKLLSGEVNLVFEKRDGSHRKMKATLSEQLVPQVSTTQVSTNRKSKGQNLNLVVLWDLDKGNWRSLRFDSLLSVNGISMSQLIKNTERSTN